MPANVLVESLQAKIFEQLDRTGHLLASTPDTPARLDWRPEYTGAWPISNLLGHLLDCMAGFCAVLYAAEPIRLAHFVELRTQPVNHSCGPAEALIRIGQYRAALEEGFGILSDEDLARKLPTVFVKDGETLLTLLLGNLEHLINHKFQLFLYLKLMGADLESQDLYHFRRQSA